MYIQIFKDNSFVTGAGWLVGGGGGVVKVNDFFLTTSGVEDFKTYIWQT